MLCKEKNDFNASKHTPKMWSWNEPSTHGIDPEISHYVKYSCKIQYLAITNILNQKSWRKYWFSSFPWRISDHSAVCFSTVWKMNKPFYPSERNRIEELSWNNTSNYLDFFDDFFYLSMQGTKCHPRTWVNQIVLNPHSCLFFGIDFFYFCSIWSKKKIKKKFQQWTNDKKCCNNFNIFF